MKHFSDHNWNKLEINKKKISRNIPNIWNLYTLINNPWIKGKIKREIRKWIYLLLINLILRTPLQNS